MAIRTEKAFRPVEISINYRSNYPNNQYLVVSVVSGRSVARDGESYITSYRLAKGAGRIFGVLQSRAGRYQLSNQAIDFIVVGGQYPVQINQVYNDSMKGNTIATSNAEGIAKVVDINNSSGSNTRGVIVGGGTRLVGFPRRSVNVAIVDFDA